MPTGDLERGWAKASLIRELAAGEKTRKQLGAEYGVAQSNITRFADRHVDAIEKVRAHLDDEWAGLWIANKRNRVAEYEADVERINASLDLVPDKDLLRTKQSALKQVAEELGQLKQEIEVGGGLMFTVRGIDLKDLQ
jgi:hypothetical protein